MNNTAMNEFESFLTQYLKDKKAIDAANRVVERGYKSEFDKLTSGMSHVLKNKVSLEVEAQFISTSKKKDHNYYGTDNGIGDISYSFDEKEYTTLSLEEIVNKVCREYYSDNSLYTGAIPYKYCYGGNPYCSPPSGYEECSFIDIKGPTNSDVIVIIKKIMMFPKTNYKNKSFEISCLTKSLIIVLSYQCLTFIFCLIFTMGIFGSCALMSSLRSSSLSSRKWSSRPPPLLNRNGICSQD